LRLTAIGGGSPGVLAGALDFVFFAGKGWSTRPGRSSERRTIVDRPASVDATASGTAKVRAFQGRRTEREGATSDPRGPLADRDSAVLDSLLR
jgi:hypothetical protein